MTEDIWKLARDWTLCASRDGIERSANLAAALNLAAIAEELRRSNEDRDQFYREVLGVLTAAKQPDVCGESNYDSISPAFRRPQDVVTCERKPGHPLDFHEGSGRRWHTKDPAGSLRSEQPAAAPDGQEGKEGG